MISWIVASSVLILAIIFLRYMCKGKISLRWQYALWLFVAVRLLVPFQFGISITLNEQPQAKNEIQVSEQWTSDEDYAGFYEEVIETYKSRENDTAGQEQRELVEENSLATKMQKIGMTIWGVGGILLGVTFIVTNSLFGARVKRNREKIDVEYTSLPVYLSSEVETPCLSGIGKTGIYVTKAVADNPVLLKHAVYHEMTHYKHGDQLWSFVRCVCLVLHWYNPLVWWAASLSKKDAEFACDEATIQRLGEGERTEYGKTLIQLTCQKRQDFLLATTMMTSGKKSINERIRLIAEKPHAGKKALILAIVVSMVLAGSTFTEVTAEPRETTEIGVGQHLKDIDWEEIKVNVNAEERAALEKYQVALEGGQVIWTDRKTGGTTILRSAVNDPCSVQEYIDEKMRSMKLETGEVIVESFLFSDVFQSGELNVCLLLRHVSKSWVILHEEDGVIYGIEVSALAFKGVQEEGNYYAAGGRGVRYYERMTFTDGDCRFEQQGIVVNGQSGDGTIEEIGTNGSDEVAIYTLIEEK